MAQTIATPEIGYVYPPGGPAGATLDVELGGYEWTPDIQFFVLDERVQLEVLGTSGKLLLAGPPYFSGAKAYNPPPLPREAHARLHLPADLPPGPLHWQVANANGTSKLGVFIVGDGPELVEDRENAQPQIIESLPVTVSGRLKNHEEIDKYRIVAAHDGPITCSLAARRLGSDFHGVLEVRDADGRIVADAADTQGLDAAVTFWATAGQTYTVAVHDLDFRGHRSYTYRLTLLTAPRVVAALPMAGPCGATREVDFLVDSGRGELDEVTQSVVFPEEHGAFEHRLQTPLGTAPPFALRAGELPEATELELRAATRDSEDEWLTLPVPGAVTGLLDSDPAVHRYRIESRKDQAWSISVQARCFGSPIDTMLSVVGPDGGELASNDDLPGTTDSGLTFTAPADGSYLVLASDVGGSSRNGAIPAVYRLAVEQPSEDFALQVPQRTTVDIASKAEMTVTATRIGGFDGPITLAFHGLPTGVSVPENLVMAPGSSELKVPLEAAADAPSHASLVYVTGSAGIGGGTATRTAMAVAGANLAARDPSEDVVRHAIVAVTMKPRVRTWPIESDERTVHQGSTHLAPIGIERLEGFTGEVLLRMSSKQPVKFRQGYMGPDVVVPPDAESALYPCFMPEGLETIDAYRMALNAVAKVPDPHGNVRYLLSTFPNNVSIGITIEGALLKVSQEGRELTGTPGRPLEVSLKIARSGKLHGPVHIELQVLGALKGLVSAAPVVVPDGQDHATLRVQSAPHSRLAGRQKLKIRAVAVEPGTGLPALADTSKLSPMDGPMLDHLRAGQLPIVAETEVTVDFAQTVH